MAFDNVYSTTTTESEYRRFDKENRVTILPFFGFKPKTRTESKISTYGGNTYVTQVTRDTYKLEKSATGIYNRYTYYKEFVRDYDDVSDFELETKVQRWLKQNKYDNIWTTPYIASTTEIYHNLYGHGSASGFLGFVIIALIVIGALASAVLGIFSGSIFALLPEFLSQFKFQVCAAPFVTLSQLAVIIFIIRLIYNKVQRGKPLKNRSQKYKDKMRAAYHKFLIAYFGEEIGKDMAALAEKREKLLDK